MFGKPKIILLVVGAVLVTATSFGATYYFISSKEEAAELMQGAGMACQRFYQQEGLENSHSVEIADAWKKDSSIVIELNARLVSGSTRYTRRLCVVDIQKGTVMIPSIRQEGRWEK